MKKKKKKNKKDVNQMIGISLAGVSYRRLSPAWKEQIISLRLQTRSHTQWLAKKKKMVQNSERGVAMRDRVYLCSVCYFEILLKASQMKTFVFFLFHIVYCNYKRGVSFWIFRFSFDSRSHINTIWRIFSRLVSILNKPKHKNPTFKTDVQQMCSIPYTLLLHVTWAC